MNSQTFIAGLAVSAALLTPQAAFAGKKASEGYSGHGATWHQSGGDNVPPGRTREKNKFPPGLYDKCFSADGYRNYGLERACAYRSRGAN